MTDVNKCRENSKYFSSASYPNIWRSHSRSLNHKFFKLSKSLWFYWITRSELVAHSFSDSFEFHFSLITVDGDLLSTLVPDKCSLWNRILDQSERNVQQDLSRNISSHRNDALVVEGRNICSRPFQINAALILKCWELEGWVLFLRHWCRDVIVAISWLCMFLPDLTDPGSCPADTDFICHSGQCVESHLVCDNKADCADGSDELDCGEWSSRVGVLEVAVKTIFHLEVSLFCPRTHLRAAWLLCFQRGRPTVGGDLPARPELRRWLWLEDEPAQRAAPFRAVRRPQPWSVLTLVTNALSFIAECTAAPSHLIIWDPEQTVYSLTTARKSHRPCLQRWWWKIPVHRLRPPEGRRRRQGDNQESVPRQRRPVSPALLVLHARFWQDGHAEGASVWLSTP